MSSKGQREPRLMNRHTPTKNKRHSPWKSDPSFCSRLSISKAGTLPQRYFPPPKYCKVLFRSLGHERWQSTFHIPRGSPCGLHQRRPAVDLVLSPLCSLASFSAVLSVESVSATYTAGTSRIDVSLPGLTGSSYRHLKRL